MKRPPRNLRQPLFNSKTVSVSLLQGLGVLIVSFVLYLFVIKSGRGELEARSFAFVSLVLANIILIIINLSWDKNIYHILRSASRALLYVIAGALACLLAVLYVPFLADLFHLAPLHLNDFILIGLAVAASLIWFEIFKIVKNKPATQNI